MPSIAVIGASNDRYKYGNRAVRAYIAQGWTVYPIHPTAQTVEGIPAFKNISDIPEPVDRASLYVPPAVGIQILDAIKQRGAKELWVNPGAGNPELLRKAEALSLPVVEACSIIAASEARDSCAVEGDEEVTAEV